MHTFPSCAMWGTGTVDGSHVCRCGVPSSQLCAAAGARPITLVVGAAFVSSHWSGPRGCGPPPRHAFVQAFRPPGLVFPCGCSRSGPCAVVRAGFESSQCVRPP